MSYLDANAKLTFEATTTLNAMKQLVSFYQNKNKKKFLYLSF